MKVKQVKMKPDEWFKIKDNPKQRDTIAHAKKALKHHLSEYCETQSRIAAAELPDGTRYKLDGHTRSAIWESGDLQAPKILYCDLYIVQNMEQIQSLYNCFDNQHAAENATDRLASALNLHGVSNNSRVFRAGGTTTALKTLYCLNTRGLVRIDVADAVLVFKKSLNIIDKANFSHFKFPAPVIAAMILTIHNDGANAINFWKDYSEDLGKKTPKKFDAIYCLSDFIRTARENGDFPRGSINAVHKITPQILPIYQKWGSMLTKRPRENLTLDDVVQEYCADIYKNLDRN